MLEEHDNCKNKLEEIYNNIVEGVKVPSKVLWCEEGEKSSFLETFQNELKEPFMNSISQTKISKQLVTSQRQALTKLIEKKGRKKRTTKNWRPISLLNVDYKIISKVFSARLKKVPPLLISSQQTANAANGCISESTRLISDLVDVTEKFKTKGYLVTIQIKKAFNSVDRSFLITTLEKFGFGTNFIDWIKIFLNDR